MSKSPLLLAAAAAALVAAGGFGAGAIRPARVARGGSGPAASQPKSLCPRGTLPAEGVCIPAPRPVAASVEATESIPRRPDRDPDYARYLLPAVGHPQAAGPSAGAPPGSTAVAIDAAPGAEVRFVGLEAEEGPGVVVHRGPLPPLTGTALVVSVRTKASRRDYLVVFANLDTSRVASLDRGATLATSQVVGHAGAAPVVWAVRLLRPGVDAMALTPGELLAESTAVWVDPRNVLPAR